jgi:hypothetical protein
MYYVWEHRFGRTSPKLTHGKCDRAPLRADEESELVV